MPLNDFYKCEDIIESVILLFLFKNNDKLLIKLAA
jgi:hypothetical protein